MDKKMLGLVSNQIPKMNPLILEGIATREMRKVESYVDQLLMGTQESFPQGLTYEGCRRLTPLERYIEVTRPRVSTSKKGQYNIARSDVYMIELLFNFQGKPIKQVMYLPYVRKGGIISIRGSVYCVSPVLADKGISLGSDDAFVRISKAPIIAKKTRVHIKVDGVARTPSVIFSWLHNRNRRAGGTSTSFIKGMETTLAHYLFCKFGLIGAFKRFLMTDIVVGTKSTITRDKYPEKDWVICTSSGIKPPILKKLKYYHITNIVIAVRRCDFDVVCESMVGSIFYIVDTFSDRIKADYIDGSIHEIKMWKELLGTIIGGITGGTAAIREAMDEHIESIDSYIDAGAKATLAKGEIFVNDIYDLLYRLIVILSGMAAQSSNTLSSLYDKQFVVLPYALKEINNNINKMVFKLIKYQSKDKDGILKVSQVETAIRSSIKVDAIMRLSDSKMHGEVNSISYPGDNLFFKMTSNACLQAKSSGKNKSKNLMKGDKTCYLHSSIAEVGSLLVLPKSDPTGRGKINPWLNIDYSGSVIRNPDNIELLEETQYYLNRLD